MNSYETNQQNRRATAATVAGGTEKPKKAERIERPEIVESTENSTIAASGHDVVSVVSAFSVSDEAARQIVDAVRTGREVSPSAWRRAVFGFVRQLKAIDELADRAPGELRSIARLWHDQTLGPAGRPFEDTWADFVYGWPRVKFPEGEGALDAILAKADAQPLPQAAKQYDAPDTRRLVALCRELQRAAGDGPFYLSCRVAAKALGITRLTAWRRLEVLKADGVIEQVEKGTMGRATRYRYRDEVP